MKRVPMLILSVMVICLLVDRTTSAGYQEKESPELAKAVGTAKVSLVRGLSASATKGKPISAKFEMEEGKLQLSVYTMKGDKFSEVIVDHKTGKVAKTEPITSGEDLEAAKKQSGAMANAKRSLRTVVMAALKGNQGFRAVSVFPELKDGHPIGEVTLVKGDQWKKVSEKLD